MKGITTANDGNDGGNGGDNGGNDGNNEGNDGVNGVNGATNENNNQNTGGVFFGYVFGKSFPERYYYFKQIVENTGLSLADKGIDTNASYTYTIARARYHMRVIANEDGLNQTQFEVKYKREHYPINISEMQDRVP